MRARYRLCAREALSATGGRGGKGGYEDTSRLVVIFPVDLIGQRGCVAVSKRLKTLDRKIFGLSSPVLLPTWPNLPVDRLQHQQGGIFLLYPRMFRTLPRSQNLSSLCFSSPAAPLGSDVSDKAIFLVGPSRPRPPARARVLGAGRGTAALSRASHGVLPDMAEVRTQIVFSRLLRGSRS